MNKDINNDNNNNNNNINKYGTKLLHPVPEGFWNTPTAPQQG